MNTVGWSAVCTRCEEGFCPLDEEDLVHVAREDGITCGGVGELLGSWG